MVLNRSVLLVEGKSADLAKFAIHSIPKQRILITFTKSQPRNSITGSNWAPPPSRSPPNQHHNRHPTAPPKHYPVIPTTGVFPPNGAVQPIFIAPSPPLPPTALPSPLPRSLEVDCVSASFSMRPTSKSKKCLTSSRCT